MSFSRGLKERTLPMWEAGYQHPFVQEIGAGTLARDKFQFYLLQDYLYLLQYAKVFALATVKATQEALMVRLTEIQHAVMDELTVHRQYMADFGVRPEQVRETKPSLYNRTYTANMLAVGQTGDLAEILATVFPCAWTYSEYAKRLKTQYADQLEGNFYRSWIENYASAKFEASFDWMFDALDELVAEKNQEEKTRIADIFAYSVEFEYMFWDMAYRKALSYHKEA